MPFSIPAAVGFIALSGVALNGLVMLSQIRMLIGDGLDTHGAIKEVDPPQANDRDGAGRFARICTDGAGHWDRRGSSAGRSPPLS
jgi:hypothetical protein